MKVLLIQSFAGHGVPPVFPIGLSYIAGSLAGHVVKGFDPNVEQDYQGRLKSLLEDFKPDVIGISLRNIWAFDVGPHRALYYKDAVMPILKLIKSCGNPLVVMGGAGFTSYATEIMEELADVDFGIFRDGEETFRLLLKNLGSPEKVRGVYYRSGKGISFTGVTGSRMDLDGVPAARRDIFDIEKYKKVQGSIGVQSKRGCVFKCAYCSYPYISGPEVVTRSCKKVVDEIEFLSKTYGIREFVFVDTVFNVPMFQAQALCEELLRRGLDISWGAWFHPRHLTADFVRLAEMAGCTQFEFSPDAYSDKMLKLLKKNITKAEIINTYKLMKKTEKAKVSYYFFVNGPGESIFTFMRLLFFLIRTKLFLGKKLNLFAITHLHIEPNTEVFGLALKRGIVDAKMKFLTSQADYEKMIFKNSVIVDRFFKLLRTPKKFMNFSKRALSIKSGRQS